MKVMRGCIPGMANIQGEGSICSMYENRKKAIIAGSQSKWREVKYKKSGKGRRGQIVK